MNNSTSSTLSTIAVDHLGSTAVLSNASGAMTELLDYHGYGNSRLTSGSATAKKTFIGQYSDSETSLSYLNARYYNPAQGQFLSEDSVFLGMGTGGKIQLIALLDPQLQNSHACARGNPMALKDAGGNWPSLSEALKWAANATDAAYNAITFGAGDRASDMGRNGVTLDSLTKTAGGIVAGTLVTSTAALAAGVAGGVAYLAAIPASGGLAAGASFGKLGTVIANQAGRITGFVRDAASSPYHGLDQAITRGVTTQMMYETVKNPLVTLQQSGGNIMYLTRTAAVILNDAGKVVTTYGVLQFQQHVVDVLNTLSK